MGRNWFLITEEEKKNDHWLDGLHIGRSVGPTIFLFDMAFLQLWEKLGDPRWNVIKPYWERVKGGGDATNRPIPPEVIPNIHLRDIVELLSTPGYYIRDEYSFVMTAEEFFEYSRNIPSDTSDDVARQIRTGQVPYYEGLFRRYFTTDDDLIFCSSTGFS
jgi:hypothetical protein